MCIHEQERLVAYKHSKFKENVNVVEDYGVFVLLEAKEMAGLFRGKELFFLTTDPPGHLSILPSVHSLMTCIMRTNPARVARWRNEEPFRFHSGVMLTYQQHLAFALFSTNWLLRRLPHTHR